jgi:gamma-glutamyltranspeptidase/glutathione hydrolase
MSPVTAAVCTVDALASEAGAELLRQGGSAADAAVGASAVLAVTTQHMCGMGGDLLAVMHLGGTAPVESLLAVGRAGAGATATKLRTEGHTSMPFRGDIRTVTVPGCVDGWLALHERHGRLPLSAVLAPAISAAEDGFPVSPLLAAALPRVADVKGGEELVGTRPAEPGEIRRRPGIARALRAIVTDGRDGWYGGEFGRALVELGKGWFEYGDLRESCSDWSAPLSIEAMGWRLWGCPAPSSSHLTLEAAAVADRLGVAGLSADDERVAHLLVEASRVVGFDRRPRLHDGAQPLLDGAELDRRAALVREDAVSELLVPGTPGGTIFLVAVDADGMAISLGQSNAAGFGAHIAVPGVGVFLQNRGVGFSLIPGSPDELRAGARPPHTLAPLVVTSPTGELVAALGTMGGDSQPQVLLQLLARLRAGASAADALDAPRWALVGPEGTGFDTWEGPPGGVSRQVVRVEDGAAFADGLRARGHEVRVDERGGGFGHAHIAVVGPDELDAATEPRALTGAAVRL